MMNALPSFTTAAHELVVPRSMPMIGPLRGPAGQDGARAAGGCACAPAWEAWAAVAPPLARAAFPPARAAPPPARAAPRRGAGTLPERAVVPAREPARPRVPARRAASARIQAARLRRAARAPRVREEGASPEWRG